MAVTDRETWRVRGRLGPPLRRGALVGLPVAVVFAVGLPRDTDAAATLGFATLLAGFIACDAPARIRVIWLTALAPVAGLAGAIGVLSSEPAALAVAVLGLFGAAVGYCSAISARAYVAALTCLLGMLVAQGLFLGTEEAPRIFAFATAGTLLQAAWASVVWIGWDRKRGRFDLADGLRAAARALEANFDLASTPLRHALRFGAALGAAVAVYNLIDLGSHGFWIPLTVLFVLRPERGLTFERLAMRAAGTLVGLVLAVPLAELIGSAALPVAIVIGSAAAVAYALLTLEYAVFTTAMTMIAIVLVHALGEPALEAAGERGAATAIGIAIAGLAFLAWPAGASSPPD